MSYVKMKTVSFDFEGLRELKTDAKNSELTDKKIRRQVISLPKNGNEFVKGRPEKDRSKTHKKYEDVTRGKTALSSSLPKLSNSRGGATNSLKIFATPATMSKEICEALERMRTSYRISAQRSFSAPNEYSVKQRRQKMGTRFPLLAKRTGDVTGDVTARGAEKLVVVGKKVSDSSSDANQAEEITTTEKKPSDGGNSVEKEEEKVSGDSDFIFRISFHDNHLSSLYANRLSELPLVSSKSFKPMYCESSVSFNAYLRSRFGRSVYVRECDENELSLDKMKHSSLNWAPLIIKKQDLSRRHGHVLRNTQV